jgi:DNA-binding transcriptional LysR family regulator
MDASDLRIFAAVAKNGSMNRAAAELNMVQSNITSRVRALEEELGVQLFIRRSRGVEPSEAGLRLLGYSEQINALFREAIAAVKEDGVPKGGLRLGTTESTLVAQLPRIVPPYLDRFQKVDLSISTGTTTGLVKLVLDGQLDGAFVAGPVNRRELDEEHILTEELVLVGPSSLPDLDSFREISNLKLIGFYSECSYRQRLDLVLEDMNLEYKVMEFDSLQSLMSCVGESSGITLLPEALVKGFMKEQSVSIHRLPKERAMSEVVFIRRHDRTSTAALLAFLEMTRELCTLETRELSLREIAAI